MGSLASLRLPTEEIEVPNAGSFRVRGLSLSDTALLMERHGQALNHIYATQIAEADDLPDAQTVAQTLMRTAPEAVAFIIATAADEADDAAALKTVSQIPVPIQVDALVKIARLTFNSEESVGNLVATVIEAASMATRALNRVNEPEASMPGSGGSEDSLPS